MKDPEFKNLFLTLFCRVDYFIKVGLVCTLSTMNGVIYTKVRVHLIRNFKRKKKIK